MAKTLASEPRAADAAQLAVAESYVDAFAKVAKESSVVLLPADAANAAGMVAQAMGAFKALGGASGGVGGVKGVGGGSKGA